MTGLSIETLAKALDRAHERLRTCNRPESSEYVQRRKRQIKRFLHALVGKSAEVGQLQAVVEAVDVACPEFWHQAADMLRHECDWPEAANHLDDMADALEEREAALAARK